MDAPVVAGRKIPFYLAPVRRAVNYKATSIQALMSYRKETIKGKGAALGVPLSSERNATIEQALVVPGTSFRGEDMDAEPLDDGVVEDFKRIGCRVYRGSLT